MSEWWTYHLSDFLLFSSRTYHRLFEIYNAAIWPLQAVAIGLGLTALALALAFAPRATSEEAPAAAQAIRSRAIAAIFAASWGWVAVAFLARRYATINWAAVYFAWAFGVEAVLLLWIGIFRGRLIFSRPAGASGWAGVALFLAALFLMPAAGPIFGRGWKAAEIFGVAPDPTAVATLGILLLASGRGRGLLMVIPVLWCAVAGFTLRAMQAPDAFLPPLAAALAIPLPVWLAWSRRGRVRV